ncbi:MAG TPA: HEAT repeat domain-containing protein [Polyangiaceae bacterium]|nr:HEAT repeat domain-containing protein [Polyangiaceae bacterium]
MSWCVVVLASRGFTRSGNLTAPMPRAFSLAMILGALLAARSAGADTLVHVPEGGGLTSFGVAVDVKKAVVAVSWALPNRRDGESIQFPIGLDASELPDDDGVQVEVIPIGQGRHIAHVRVGVRGSQDQAWEALLTGGPRGRTPLFAGRTGFGEGDPGERTGTAVQIAKGTASSYALVGTLREDLRICGQARTLLDPRAVYPDSLDLRPATVQRISAEERAGAVAIAAEDKGTAIDKPLATLLVASGSSVVASTGRELTDGDPATGWHEDRPGVGQGEFVTLAAPSRVPMTRVDIVLPPAAPGAGVPPKSFYLTTETQIFEVTLPDDAARKPGEVYEVAFPGAVATSCLSLVLNDAFARAATHPDVGLAEIVAYSEFDGPGATLDDVAKRLSGPRGDAAAQVLERAPAALGVVAATYEALDALGRARAIDVAASADKCEDAAPLLVRALCASGGVESEDVAGEAIRKAREKLERCPGAAPVLAEAVRGDASSRACLAPLLATLAPAGALVPLADAIAATPEADAKTRAVLRSAFGAALAAAPAGVFASLAGDAKRSAAARLEMFRAAEGRVTDVRIEADAALGELLRGTPAMRVRYLALEPLGHLARAGDPTALGWMLAMIAHDDQWPVRARALEFAAGLAPAEGAIVGALNDPEPRVREAALSALATGPTVSGSAARAASEILGHDDWPFVKVQAIAVLMNAPPAPPSVEALGAALEDPSARVRGAAIVALARAGAAASTWRTALRKKLDDKDEDADVRSAAASALGALCDRESAGRLTELARPLAGVAADEDAREVGLGAVVGLAALHPPDLKDRLAPLLAPSAPPAVRSAAAHAMAARTHCP